MASGWSDSLRRWSFSSTFTRVLVERVFNLAQFVVANLGFHRVVECSVHGPDWVSANTPPATTITQAMMTMMVTGSGAVFLRTE